MSSLTSTQINNTYPGLLKLANSTTGITSSIQSVEDGLGGDTGLKIKQDYIGGSSLVPYPKADTTTMAYGIGVATSGAGTAFIAGSHNLLYSMFFYDRGNITYSAISYSIGTVSSTSDVVEMGIYNSQVTASGYQPKDLLVSWTLSGSEVTTLGLAKKTLPSNLTLVEGGLYYLVYVITNPTVVTPTVRFRGSSAATTNGAINGILGGWVTDTTNAGYVNVNKVGVSLTSGQSYYSGINGPLQNSYAPATFVGTTSPTSSPVVGFVLHPVN